MKKCTFAFSLLFTLILLLFPADHLFARDNLFSQDHIFSRGLEVHFIDAGQGEAVLLRCSGATVLVDSGRDTTAGDYLRDIGVETIDLAVATHAHADHIGGFPEIFEGFPVERVWYNGQSHTTLAFEHFVDTLLDSEAEYYEPVRGDTLTFTDDAAALAIEVLHPETTAGDYEGHLHDKNIVLRAVYGEFSVLLTGDAERETEATLLEHYGEENLRSTVLKLGHHGSNSSSSREFLKAVDPEIVVYSTAADNPYGHPHREVVERVEELPDARLYGTDTHGTLVVHYDGTYPRIRLPNAEETKLQSFLRLRPPSCTPDTSRALIKPVRAISSIIM
ncbi:MAG: ComEC/Rec2 family competence protein [Sediminispirochaetaceae bacterium]